MNVVIARLKKVKWHIIAASIGGALVDVVGGGNVSVAIIKAITGMVGGL